MDKYPIYVDAKVIAIIEAARALSEAAFKWNDFDGDPESDESVDICDELTFKAIAVHDALAALESE